jgi:hypothetical protein
MGREILLGSVGGRRRVRCEVVVAIAVGPGGLRFPPETEVGVGTRGRV